MWDLLTQLYKRFGLWALLGVALVFGAVWWLTDINAQPCEKVSVFFGFIEYNKACNPPPPTPPIDVTTECQELQQLLEQKHGNYDKLKQLVYELQAQVKEGNLDAQTELQKSTKRLKELQNQIHDLAAQQQIKCPGQ
ncbi:MAG: hypothetical protein Q7U88_11705 [Desulfocapsaceae bacterium]|nr:hypothetical protein [Desulfocapsaceae bacterium]